MLLAIADMNFIDKENKFELQNNGRNKTKAHTNNGSIQIANFRFQCGQNNTSSPPNKNRKLILKMSHA